MYTLYMEMDWKGENLPQIYLPLSKVLNVGSRNHVFVKYKIEDFWDHTVSKLIFFQGTVLSLYARSRVIRSSTRLPNIIIISIMETIR